MLLRKMVLLVLLLPVSLFGDQQKPDKVDQVLKTNGTKVASAVGTTLIQRNLTNSSYTGLSLNWGYSDPLFDKDYSTGDFVIDFSHLTQKKSFCQISLVFHYQINFYLREEPEFTSEFPISGWEFYFIYGLPLVQKYRKDKLFLLSLDMGGLVSLYSSRDSNFKLEDNSIMETRLGFRFSRLRSRDMSRYDLFWSTYLHIAFQFQNFRAKTFDSNSATPTLPIDDFKYDKVQPGLVLGMMIQASRSSTYQVFWNFEINFFDLRFPNTSCGIGFAW